MKRFYSQTTQTTYLEGLHKTMPNDAKEIAEERYLEVLANPAPNKVRGHDAEGLPILIDLPPESLAALERGWRDGEVLRVQWLRDRHRDEQDLSRAPTLTSEQFVSLLSYMQSLRDWPENLDFPVEQSRPVPPDWIAEQIK
ncbi:hypothetical protein SAMN04490185_4171 [Pseudomonas frederiksbergensis]|uniref:Phage tail assembly chaperone-like domain-containing protein n=1 Tax=Pseudomonas frederiksbergensis TaxID=104087 RepID=A0A1H5DG44_9PSED|nr:phage tail assembly chaperone [Pseudomonas frederiksbergensis]SED77826.1 hypothetical protein SAMN04490185_4171 [Pseudomonas frederiksbergensis]